MQLTKFNAYCPFEIGDKIKKRRWVSLAEAECFKLDPAAVVEEVHTITDIVCEHSVKYGTVTFLYELDDSGTLVHIVAPSAKEQAGTPAAQSGTTEPFPPPTSGPIRRKQPQDQPRNEHDGKRVEILICDESSQLPPEFKEFIKKRFG